MRRHHEVFDHTRRLRACLLMIVALTLIDSVGAFQSGRRAPRQERRTQAVETAPTAPATQAAATETSAKATDKKASARFKLLVATDLENDPSGRAAAIYGKFFLRLKESPDVQVIPLGVLKREEAVKRAKAEAESYVVWLNLEKDSVQGTNIVINSPDFRVKYEVFAPVTAQSRAKGKVYFQAMGGPGKRRDKWPSSTPVKITPEAAGEEAADMLLDWFTRIEAYARQGNKN